jgi:DNA adenine methylase
MKSPYPYFGGKSTIMHEVWKRLGDTRNFVDPFLGSNAPLLSRPGWDWAAMNWRDGKNRIETVNDKDCFVANFWRALNDDPASLAKFADWPINEADMHARHLWLVNNEDFIKRMKSEPDYYDVKVAGWWVWGLCQWIGSGWGSKPGNTRPNLGDAGVGVQRTTHQKRPNLGGTGRGVHRTKQQKPHLTGSMGINRVTLPVTIYEYFELLSARLRRVRVCCGDWSRVLGPTPTEQNGLTSIILDPPYGKAAKRDKRLYAADSLDVANKVRDWAMANGDNPKLRIALFGYEVEHSAAMPPSWERLAWKAQGGYSNQGNGNDNKYKERIWFSPACLRVARQPEQMSLKF